MIRLVRLALVLHSILFTFGSSAQIIGATYKRILIPVLPSGVGPALPPVGGAFGSQWVTSVHVVHNAAAPVHMYPFGFCNGPAFCFFAPPRIPAGTTIDLGIGHQDQRAAFLFVESNALDHVTVTVRARDISRSALNFGTTIPTPSEDVFSSQAFSISDVPSDLNFRSRLRIYSLDNRPAEVVVRLYDGQAASSARLFDVPPPPDKLLRVSTHVLETQPEIPFVSPPNGTPALLEIPLDLTSLPAAAVRVEVQPTDGATRLWAFVSVTNNQAQHITVLRP